MNNLDINKKERRFFKEGSRIYMVVILIIASFVAGLLVGENHQADSEGALSVSKTRNEDYGKVTDKDAIPQFLKEDIDFDLYWEVWEKIQQQFIDRPVGETKLLYGSLMGMVASLGDPYSMFLEPKTAQDFQDELAGHFEGIGAEIGIKNNMLTIISPLPENPAEKAGLKPNDIILAIDGHDTTGIDLSEAVRHIRGEKGTNVKLLISRKGREAFEVEVVRDVIQIVSVRWEKKDNNIAYIQVTNFHEDTSGRFQRAVSEILLENPKGIILDLRNNPGGFLDQSIGLASYWVESGDVVVIEKFSDDDQKSYLASNNPVFNGIPTIVLINQGTASGSEIMAGALRDHGLAQLVGMKTFGKGSVQNLEELSDGSAIKLTIARWLTPNGYQIDQQGIEPDIEVDLTEEDYNASLDPQLDKAMELLTDI